MIKQFMIKNVIINSYIFCFHPAYIHSICHKAIWTQQFAKHPNEKFTIEHFGKSKKHYLLAKDSSPRTETFYEEHGFSLCSFLNNKLSELNNYHALDPELFEPTGEVD